MKLHTPSVVLTKTSDASGRYTYSVDVTVLFQGEYYTYDYNEPFDLNTDSNGDPLVTLKVKKGGDIGATTIAPVFIHADLGELTFSGDDGSVTVKIEELDSRAMVGSSGVKESESEEESLGGGK